jgi:hypothetical protein
MEVHRVIIDIDQIPKTMFLSTAIESEIGPIFFYKLPYSVNN